MIKQTVEYVASASVQGFFPNNSRLTEKQWGMIVDGMQECVKIIQTDLEAKCTNYNPSLSVMYNAYTEGKNVPTYAELKNFGMDACYADSGGLQIVTKQKEITEKLKSEIYGIQAYADYAMCFDVIPLSRREGSKLTRNERSNVGNKVFHHDKLLEAGKATGLNIKAQIAAFKELGTKTKVVIIVQGNNAQDMVDFYKEIELCLDQEDYKHISGLAVADTCMGNGELESIEMLKAAHAIGKFAHKSVREHLHILGVGSITRMRPIIYLRRSKYLDTFKHISYDSSSHTSCLTYGLLKINGTCTSLGPSRSHKTETPFRAVHNLVAPYMQKMGVTEADYLDIMLGSKQETFDHNTVLEAWTHAAVKNRADLTGDDNIITVANMAKGLYSLYQIHNFMICINDIWNEKFSGDPMTNLLKVKDDESMDRWMKQMKRTIKSKRIERSTTMNTLEDEVI